MIDPDLKPRVEPEAAGIIADKICGQIIELLNSNQSINMCDKIIVLANVVNNIRLTVKLTHPDKSDDVVLSLIRMLAKMQSQD